MSTSLKGKGLWAWRLWELDQALSVAPEMQVSHILYKVAQGPLGTRPAFYIHNAAALAERIRQAGFVPLAWSFTTLADPTFTAQSVLRALENGYEGFVFNAEDATRGRRAEATAVGQALREAGVDLTRLFLCSYPTPLTHHPTIPYNEMGPYCQGGLMPMAYGTYRLPPDIVVDQWTYAQNRQWMQQQGLELPIAPVLGPHYDELGNQLMTREEFQTWLNHIAPYGPSFLSLYTAALVRPPYFAPFRAFVLGPGEEPATREVWVRRLGGGVIFAIAGRDGTQRSAVPYGTPLTGVGEPILVGSEQWLQIRDSDGPGWIRAATVSDTPPPPYPDPGPLPTPPPGHLLTAWTTTQLNLRSEPFVRPDTLIGCAPQDARVHILENTAQAADWLGEVGRWLKVRLEPSGPEVWAAAWYLTATNPETPDLSPTVQVQVHSPSVGWLRIREEPSTSSPELTRVDHGALLWALEPEADVQRKVGQLGEWIYLRTPTAGAGYAAAWYLQLSPSPPEPPPAPEPSLEVVVDSPQVGWLRIRQGPGTGFPELTQVDHGTRLQALEPEAEVRRKVGQSGEWLHVQTPGGEIGYAAAWHLQLPAAPPPTARYVFVESPEHGLRVRSGPGTDRPQVWWVPHRTVLESLEDEESTNTKVGEENAWLEVETPSRRRGFVAAWYLRLPDGPDTRTPVTGGDLPYGLTAEIFGMHSASVTDTQEQHAQRIRGLFESAGKRGWILFTEAIYSNPNPPFNPIIRDRLWDWASRGYGVVVRLNHDYHPSGTLPLSNRYDEFAASCARWVELYLKRDDEPTHRYNWIIQIANEQNNPSEHPGDHGHIQEHITPELYASAFNRVYAAIKTVLPHVYVAPGAIDPYNSTPYPLLGGRRYRPLDYYSAMLEQIDALDAVLLHAYTHGPVVGAITSLQTFNDPFLGDHYFDFQTYRQFAERIPARWKDVPLLIGESNHICRPPNAPRCDDPHHQGWINANIGWVRAAYAEINAWNERPYSQQIWGLLLYRWIGDQWRLEDKPGIHEDFRQALPHDYRWRA